MDRVLGRYSEYAYALLRIVAGLLFVQHGVQKIFALLLAREGAPADFLSQRWFAGIIEAFGGLLIASGTLGSWVAFIASGEMAVAYFQSHFPRGAWPILNGGELAVLYCFIFLYIASRGSGPWSIDRAMRRR